jgi:uncharacterized protein YcnI
MATIPARRGAVALISGLLLVGSAAPALGHVTIPDGSEIPAGSTVVVHLRVPHGCEGAATDTLSVQLPDGIVSAQAEWVPGWTVETEMVESEPYERFGETLTERVGVITWSGGSLPDELYYDFAFRATYLLEPGEVAIPVIQRCGDLEEAWIEIPVEGQSADDLELPAPTITIVEATEEGDGH